MWDLKTFQSPTTALPNISNCNKKKQERPKRGTAGMPNGGVNQAKPLFLNTLPISIDF
jgi:hypothetical protein